MQQQFLSLTLNNILVSGHVFQLKLLKQNNQTGGFLHDFWRIYGVLQNYQITMEKTPCMYKSLNFQAGLGGTNRLLFNEDEDYAQILKSRRKHGRKRKTKNILSITASERSTEVPSIYSTYIDSRQKCEKIQFFLQRECSLIMSLFHIKLCSRLAKLQFLAGLLQYLMKKYGS